MKRKYKELMAPQIIVLPEMGVIEIEYTLFPETKRLCDVSNILSIVDKFFSDALVELGRIEDDNYTFIPRVSYNFGAVDKHSPRAEIIIKEI